MSAGPVAALIILGLVVIVGLAALRSAINIVQQGQVGVVKRLGEYTRTHEPGLVIIAPFVSTLQHVDMREIPRPGDRQEVITKDNVVVTVNATIFTQVVDAKAALFSVANFDVGIDALARTALRSVIGTLSLDQALSERERINTDVQQQMEVVTDKWGIRISRIEIVEISPPPNILQALALEKQADQEKRARILQSQGQQQSAINVAQGDAQAAVTAAEGQKKAAILRAEGSSPSGHPRGRGTVAGDRDRVQRDQGRRSRPDAGGDPAARHAVEVRRQRQLQDRGAVRERGADGRGAGAQGRARRRRRRLVAARSPPRRSRARAAPRRCARRRSTACGR